MGRPSELFGLVAMFLLGFSLIARFIGPSGFVSFNWRSTTYGLPPGSISVGLATLFCFFATVYSLWMLPFNKAATLWHFWLTTAGIGVFWLAFYRAPASRTAVWVFFAAPAAVFLVQAIFVWNLVQAIFRMPRTA